MTTIADILNFIETIAPPHMAESWDNVGFLCGRRERTVKRVLVALDPFRTVIDEAIALKADLIVTHHPLIFGEELKLGNAADALRAGIAMVSEDRKGVGLLLDQSIEDKIAFTAMQVNGEFLRKIGPFTLKSGGAIRHQAETMIKELDIRCFGPTQHSGTLSGGNQQKVCIARALTMNPKLIFVSEPTRGIDIGAKKLVLETLVKLNREQGMTVVMVSSELMELRSICDRIAIVAEGELVDILPVNSSDADFGLAMSGIKPGTQS